MKKLTIIWIVALSFIILSCQSYNTATNGQITVGITDRLAGSVDSLVIHIYSITLHNTNGDPFTAIIDKDFDVITLGRQGITDELATLNVPEGVYNLAKLQVTNVKVVMNGVAKDVILPSNVIKIPLMSNLERSKNNAIILDFQAIESLHETRNGKIIMLPVIKIFEHDDAQITRQNLAISIKNTITQRTRTVLTDTKGITGEGRVVTDNDIKNIIIDNMGRINDG